LGGVPEFSSLPFRIADIFLGRETWSQNATLYNDSRA